MRSSLFIAAVFFSPFLAATTFQRIAGSVHSGLMHMLPLMPINDAATVVEGRKHTPSVHPLHQREPRLS